MIKFLLGIKAKFHPYSLLPPSFCHLGSGLKSSCSGQSNKLNLNLGLSWFNKVCMCEIDAMVVLFLRASL